MPIHLLLRFALKRHGYIPNFIFPRTFNEKIMAKMLFDRSPLLITAADKLASRTYVSQIVGDEFLPKVYAIWSSPEEIELDPSWGPVAIKANHGSGFVKLVHNPAAVDLVALRALPQKSVNFNYGRTFGEWCYRDIAPRVFAEQMIGDGDPNHLVDYKIFCFAGVPRFLKVIKGLMGSVRSFYADVDFNDLGVTDGQAPFELTDRKPPPNLKLMLDLARRISADFEMVRVDMYNVDGTILIGELPIIPRPDRSDSFQKAPT